MIKERKLKGGVLKEIQIKMSCNNENKKKKERWLELA